jgi:hypothetical protein
MIKKPVPHAWLRDSGHFSPITIVAKICSVLSGLPLVNEEYILFT